MNEQDDIPRLDGLRHDDPPFRSFFGAEPMKSEEVLERQRAQMPKKPQQPEFTAAQLEPAETVMTDNNDVIALIHSLADGSNYVKVDKLIKALTCT